MIGSDFSSFNPSTNSLALRILNISPDNIKDYQNQVSAEIENTEIYTLKTPEVHYVF